MVVTLCVTIPRYGVTPHTSMESRSQRLQPSYYLGTRLPCKYLLSRFAPLEVHHIHTFHRQDSTTTRQYDNIAMKLCTLILSITVATAAALPLAATPSSNDIGMKSFPKIALLRMQLTHRSKSLAGMPPPQSCHHRKRSVVADQPRQDTDALT